MPGRTVAPSVYLVAGCSSQRTLEAPRGHVTRTSASEVTRAAGAALREATGTRHRPSVEATILPRRAAVQALEAMTRLGRG